MDTREQIIARTTDRWISLTANAGSGKTRVLVNRYCDILFSGIDPSEIVAITFTRKAASEMITRVTKLVEAEERKPENTPARIKMLRRIRERLTAARISTIHSFCTSLLREYPIEADIDPNFAEISDSDRYIMLRDSIDLIIEDKLERSFSQQNFNLKKLLKTLGPANTADMLFKFIAGAEDFRVFQKMKNTSWNDIVLKNREKSIANLFLPDIKTGLDMLMRILDFIRSHQESASFMDKIEALEELIGDSINQIEQIFASKNYSGLTILIKNLNKIPESELINKSFTINKRKCKNIDFSSISYYTEMTGRISLINDISTINDNFEYDAELLNLTNEFISLADDAYRNFAEKKNDAGLIDFSDMLVKTHILLKDKAIAERVREDIKFLLVDEFQDTNRLQYEIIKLISPDILAGSSRGVNLFLVGDEKQSIYGFRNADVRIFLEAIRDIANVNKRLLDTEIINQDYIVNGNHIKASTYEESIGKLGLSSTFRLQPVISSFTNIVCSGIMDRRNSEFDVDYKEFVCGRNVEALKNNDSYIGSVDILLARKNDDDDDYNQEAILLARKIKSMVGREIFDDNGEKRHLKYGDFAVLLRSRTRLEDLSDSFRKESVPFTIHSGRGFFNTPEIRDIVAFLKFLANNNDDLSLTVILKSPFFSFDDTLMLIIAGTNGEHIYEKMSGIDIKLLPNKKHRLLLVRAREIMRELFDSAGMLTIPGLIHLILEKTAWYGSTVKYGSHRQMHANMEKFIAHARNFEKKGFNTIYDFLYDTELIINIGSEEAEAAVSLDSMAVNILTIHASKGLEFPVVALFDCNYQKINTANLLFTEDLGLTFNISAVKNNIEIPIKPSLHLLNRKLINARENAEAKRLLYVALTRAEDRLIITGTIDKKIKGFLELIFNNKFLRNLNLDNLGDDGSELEINDKLKILGNNQIIDENIKYTIKITTNIDECDDLSDSNISFVKNDNILLQYAGNEEYSDTFSPTKFMKFNESAVEYFKRYTLGLDDDTNIYDNISSGEDNFSGTDKGTLIHKILENISYWINSRGIIQKSRLAAAVDESINSLSQGIEKYRELIVSEIINVASTPLIQKYSARLQNSESEMDLSLPVGDDILNGKIDMLVRDSSGNMEVWDWKSNSVKTQQDLDKLSTHYYLQMKIYCYFLSMLYPGQKTYRARLLFTAMALKDRPDEEWTRTHEWNRQELLGFGKKLEALQIEMKKFA